MLLDEHAVDVRAKGPGVPNVGDAGDGKLNVTHTLTEDTLNFKGHVTWVPKLQEAVDLILSIMCRSRGIIRDGVQHMVLESWGCERHARRNACLL